MKSRRLIARPEAQDRASYRFTFAPTRKIVVKCSQHMPAWMRSRYPAVHARQGPKAAYAPQQSVRLFDNQFL